MERSFHPRTCPLALPYESTAVQQVVVTVFLFLGSTIHASVGTRCVGVCQSAVPASPGPADVSDSKAYIDHLFAPRTPMPYRICWSREDKMQW